MIGLFTAELFAGEMRMGGLKDCDNIVAVTLPDSSISAKTDLLEISIKTTKNRSLVATLFTVFSI